MYREEDANVSVLEGNRTGDSAFGWLSKLLDRQMPSEVAANAAFDKHCLYLGPL